MKVGFRIILALGALALASCGENEVILEGPREPIRPADRPTAVVNRVEPLSLPAPTANADWDHKGGSVTHSIRHPALRQPLQAAWSLDIGTGNSRSRRLAADPVVSAGRVFVMDALSVVSAVSTSGEPLWTTDLTPPDERPGDASGGGLAVVGGRLFATTGYGRLTVLDAATGSMLWEQRLDAAVTAAPLVADGVVYLTTRNAAGWAIDAETGRILWQVLGTPEDWGLFGGPSPVLAGDLVVFPFASGQLVAAVRDTGQRAWLSSIAGARTTRVFSQVRDVSDPVVAGGRVYAGTHSGRTGAIDATTGQLLWTAEEGAISPVWVSGGALFLISDENALVRLDAVTGTPVWRVELPFLARERESRRKTIYAHYGPVLAGGRLVVLSDDGLIRNFDPASGALVSTETLPAGAARNPVIANGTLYVVTEDGRLHAFR